MFKVNNKDTRTTPMANDTLLIRLILVVQKFPVTPLRYLADMTKPKTQTLFVITYKTTQ